MNPLNKIKQTENLHVLFWLIKDSCWMLEWKIAGTIAFFPTFILATYICVQTYTKPLSFIANLAVFFWIAANSCWMFSEFYLIPLKSFSMVFFVIGVLLILFYLFQIFVIRTSEE